MYFATDITIHMNHSNIHPDIATQNFFPEAVASASVTLAVSPVDAPAEAVSPDPPQAVNEIAIAPMLIFFS